MSTQCFIYKNWEQLSLKASFFPAAKTAAKNRTLLYFHGGGFLFGEREDLPKPYLELFLESGLNVLSFDYPLAPETPLSEIVDCLEEAVRWFLENYQTQLKLSEPDFFLFGRSAGGYLASILTTNNYEHQRGLIRFYGYHHFEHSAFVLPSAFYQRFPKVPPLIAQQSIKKRPTTDGSLAERFSLYLSARQYGNWLSYLGPITDKLTVNNEQLKQFPPVFMAHCQKDPDVPIDSSRQLSEAVERCLFLELDLDEHDFDREENSAAIEVYQKLIGWLNDQTQG